MELKIDTYPALYIYHPVLNRNSSFPKELLLFYNVRIDIFGVFNPFLLNKWQFKNKTERENMNKCTCMPTMDTINIDVNGKYAYV